MLVVRAIKVLMRESCGSPTGIANGASHGKRSKTHLPSRMLQKPHVRAHCLIILLFGLPFLLKHLFLENFLPQRRCPHPSKQSTGGRST